jgi:hypothetical protein
VVIVLAGVVLLVTLIMVTLHKIARSKEKYRTAAGAEAQGPTSGEDAIDEDELRMQVMRELLEEAQNGKDANPPSEK